jgi:fatty-acyl-CoA synthase
MIIRAGEKIFPKEIEEFLFGHPKIAQVAVFGVPDPFYGEEVMAWIQLHAGEEMSEQDVRDYCKGRIAHFKIPRHIWFVTEFPMTVTGKLQKFRMREIATEKMGLTEKAAEPGKPGKPENTAKQGKAEAGAG